MSTLPHCKSAQAVFKHVVRKVGVTAALKSEFVHPDSCLCYSESVENQVWVCWTPIFARASSLQPRQWRSLKWHCSPRIAVRPLASLLCRASLCLRKHCKESMLIERRRKKRIHTLRMHKSTWLFKNTSSVSLEKGERRCIPHMAAEPVRLDAPTWDLRLIGTYRHTAGGVGWEGGKWGG